MRVLDVLLMEYDHAWHHKWETMSDALADLADDEAEWQAPAYRDCTPEPGWPLPGTVRWQIAHIAHWTRYYTAMIGARGQTERPPEPERNVPEGFSLADELAELQAAHTAHRAAIAALTDEDLPLTVPNGASLAEFIITTTRHDIWHAGQIVVARRLWRTRNAT